MIVVAALYKFVRITDTRLVREQLFDLMHAQGIKGTIILAEEGINGTVAGTREAIDTLKNYFARDERFSDGIEYKESFTVARPFKRLKVSVKKEIVTLKVAGVDPTTQAGTYVDAQEWNRLLNDPAVTVIDVRNDFEVGMGTFKNALNPKTHAFSDFPEFVRANLSPDRHKKIAMSCTGGIRCEKASALMKTMGFEEVFHLKGGVLKYLEDTPAEESLWQGECFVFDERIALDHDLKPKE